jgi:threonylcarbamoyladenosine tRNA methylthiotransferase MtaB
MVKIQEGCDQVCAYCIVPKVRGRERSIPPEELVNQIRQRVGEGCREVVLTGTQLGTYGFDIPGANLPYLLRRILAETDVARLRVSSLQPQEINAELLQIWLEDSRLCSHFHVPLQSGSDSILKTMRRQYTRNQFAETVELIRQAIPDAGITADFIVGFPGEGDREFEESLAFVKAMGFSDMHVFPYSKRPGTSAAYLNEQVPEAVKKERMGRMLELARQGFERFRRVQLGQTRPVLWEPVRPNRGANRRRGLTDNYIRVHALDGNDGGLGKVAAKLDNAITPARLVELSDTSVLAQPV